MESKKEYGANDQWPSHTNKEVVALYELAKSYGWTLVEQTNHPNHLLKCAEKVCQFRIYSTPKGQDSYVKRKRKAVINCVHNNELTNRIVDIELRLERISRLVNAAKYRLEIEKIEVGVESATTEVELQELFHQVEKIENDLATLPEEINRQDSAGELIITAENEVGVVRDMLRPLLPGGNRVAECKARLRRLKIKLREIS